MAKTVFNSFGAIESAAWNPLIEPGNPFMRHEFLAALEKTRCIGRGTGWEPMIATATAGGEFTAAIPAFLRGDSYGEYIFDWGWANAYAKAGLPYYPKVTVAAPFTPATGRRLLTGAEFNPEAAGSALQVLEEEAIRVGASGVHFLCLTHKEQKFLSAQGYLARITHQYHWLNRGFETFDDFLATLRSHRRKEIKRERKKCGEHRLEIRTLTGSDIKEEHMRAMYAFYIQTYSRKWGSPYLNLECFLELRRTMADALVLVLAREGDRYAAGAFALRQDDRLFGRYWGATAHYPFLHFELCLYRLIDFAISEKITLFEAGAQGEHKFERGFTAMPVLSSHKLFHPHGAEAIASFLKKERRQSLRALREFRQLSPIKKPSA